MTAYVTNPVGKVVPLLQPNVPSFAWGSRLPGTDCKMLITSDSVSANVVTLTVTIIKGNIPAVGDLIFTYGTTNSAGGLNQTTGIAIASVNINAGTGIGTITFPLTIANQGSTPDVGYAISVPGITTETPTPGNGGASASQQFALMSEIGKNGTPFSVDGKFAGAPGAFEIDVQVASIDLDSYYQTIQNGNMTSVDATNNTFHLDGTLVNARFVRLLLRSRTNTVALYATISAG
jgi:hypothetical protein